jgi:flagellar hook-associated protein 1 FlgK
MPDLTTALSIAVRSMLANQGALETTTNNISNANTPGYSRQRAIFVESDPLVVGRLTFGTGVDLERIESVRNPVLDLRIAAETQREGKLDAVVTGMQQVEPMFSGTGGDIADDLSKFFNSLNQLATAPASIPMRQAVLTAADNLANSFRTIAGNLQRQQSNVDLDIGQSIAQINTLTAQIAKLNSEIQSLENIHQDASAFVDQRTEAIRELSGLIDVSVIPTDSGITLTTASGTALAAGAQSFELKTQLGSSGMQHILAAGTDITASLSGGRLAGQLQLRDNSIPSVMSDLDTLAAGLITNLNAAHHAGFDLNGIGGTDLFVAPAVSGVGAAAGMTLNISDPALIAASSDGASGSNGNIAKLTAVRTQAIAGGQNPFDFYANVVFKVGNEVATNSAEQDASNLILQQLQSQRASVSGVSLDEEAANLIRYQKAFEAAARVVTTINELLDAAVNLGRY